MNTTKINNVIPSKKSYKTYKLVEWINIFKSIDEIKESDRNFLRTVSNNLKLIIWDRNIC
jgi:hypothetical protein